MSMDSGRATRDPLLTLMITGLLTSALLFATVLPIGRAPSDNGGPLGYRQSWTDAIPDSAGDGSNPPEASPRSWPAGPVPAGGSTQSGGIVSRRPSPSDVAEVSIAG